MNAIEATKMKWLKQLSGKVLEEKTDAKAAKALFVNGEGTLLGRMPPPRREHPRHPPTRRHSVQARRSGI